MLSRTPNEMTNKELRRARVRFNRREEAVPFFFFALFCKQTSCPRSGCCCPQNGGKPCHTSRREMRVINCLAAWLFDPESLT